MPLPKPKTGEDREDFIGRCMKELAGEFDDDKQRAAVCNRQWREDGKAGGEEDLEYRRITIDFECKAIEENGTLEGYGAAFDNIDSYGDIIEKGAFKTAIGAYRRKAKWPAMLFDHNRTKHVGQWTDMREDDKGLFVKGKLWIEGTTPDPDAMKAYRLAKSDTADVGLSIGFIPKEFEIDLNKGVRRLKGIDLREVSIVWMPANELAVLTAVKSARQIKTIRDFEAFLRVSGGFSRAEAEMLARDGFKGLEARDELKAAGDDSSRDEGVQADIRALIERNISTLSPECQL